MGPTHKEFKKKNKIRKQLKKKEGQKKKKTAEEFCFSFFLFS